MWASDNCRLECPHRPCGFGHCDRFTVEQEHPEHVRVDGDVLDRLLRSRRDLARGTFVDGRLLAELRGEPEG